MLTSPLYAQKASEKPDAMVLQERDVRAPYSEAERKESLKSHLSDGQKKLGKPRCIVFILAGKLDQVFCSETLIRRI